MTGFYIKATLGTAFNGLSLFGFLKMIVWFHVNVKVFGQTSKFVDDTKKVVTKAKG